MGAEINYYNGLTVIFEDDNIQFLSFKKSAEFRMDRHREYTRCLSSKILINLERLLSCLIGPNKLIEKRNHKLVDYEACLSELKLKNSYGPGYYATKEVGLYS